ncbi:thioesterase II family protein [Nocardia paucivorans]|uniref:thioesterase II family protein n=1 Tax=Nocardia paucivorans TaxID=114259 RepID=UPI000592F12B|nr:alpha/beta fold hydrolase [Nocardia paucivorans]
MPNALGWLRNFHKPTTGARLPFILFPHAGSGASGYRSFSKRLSADFDVAVVQYPGRQDRIAEPPATEMSELAAGAFAEFAESSWSRGVPITVFGHSVGAIAAFEFARMAEASGVEVGLLVASSAVAPALVVDEPPNPTDDDDLLDRLTALHGTDADVLANREIMRLALPVLKADYRAYDRYECGPDVRVRAPIRVLGGADDEFVTIQQLRAWGAHSEQGATVTLFEGGHFYLNNHIDDVAELLSAAAIFAN